MMKSQISMWLWWHGRASASASRNTVARACLEARAARAISLPGTAIGPVPDRSGPVRSRVAPVRSGPGPVSDRSGPRSSPHAYSVLGPGRSGPVRSGPGPIYRPMQHTSLQYYQAYMNAR